MNRATGEHDAIEWFTIEEMARLQLADDGLVDLIASLIADAESDPR